MTQPDTTAPPIPVQNLKFPNLSDSSITISWDSSLMGDLKGYKVYWDTAFNGYTYNKVTDVLKDTSYTITDLSPGKSYHIAVTCYDNSGNESWYSTDTVVTILNNRLRYYERSYS